MSHNGLQTPPNAIFALRILRMVPISRGRFDIVAGSFKPLNRQNLELGQKLFGLECECAGWLNQPIQMADPGWMQFSLDFE